MLRRLSVLVVAAVFFGTGPNAVLGQSHDRPNSAQEEMLRSETVNSPAPQRENAQDDLSAALRLTLKIFEYPSLSGDYRINADGTIAMPLIGRVQVSGLGTTQLESIIASKLAEIAGREIYVMVEIAEFRHVYVTGYVNSPGSSQWRPGMTVLQAVATAGGLYRAERAADTGARDQVRAKKVVDEQKRALAALARVRAEQSGASSIDLPRQLVSLVGRAEAEAQIKAQTSVLVSRRTTLENQLAAIERGKSLASRELDGLKTQTERINTQLKLRRESSRKLQDLQSRGLALAERSLEQEIKISELEEKSVAISVAVAHIQSMIAGFERDAVALQQNRRAEMDSEMLRLEREVSQNAIELEGLTGQPQAQPDRAPGHEAGATVSYTITRREGEQTRVLSAEDATALVPGDVLAVAPAIH